MLNKNEYRKGDREKGKGEKEVERGADRVEREGVGGIVREAENEKMI